MKKELINDLIVENQEKLKSIARKYCKDGDFDDFHQLLLIEIWEHMRDKFNPQINNDPAGYLLSPLIINQLCVNVWRGLYKGKTNEFENSMVLLEEEVAVEPIPIDVYSFTVLDEEEKWFLQLTLDRLAFKVPKYKIAEDMGITFHQFKYKLHKIKKKLNGKKSINQY